MKPVKYSLVKIETHSEHEGIVHTCSLTFSNGNNNVYTIVTKKQIDDFNLVKGMAPKNIKLTGFTYDSKVEGNSIIFGKKNEFPITIRNAKIVLENNKYYVKNYIDSNLNIVNLELMDLNTLDVNNRKFNITMYTHRISVTELNGKKLAII